MAECANKTDQNNIPNCPICMDTLEKPVFLPCLHSFCESCIDDYAASVCKGEPGLTSSFSCPSCRADTKLLCGLDNVGSDDRKLAEKSCVNAELLSPAESEKSENTKMCEVCLIRGLESVVATSWCQDCREALCDSCAEYHQSMKGLRSHKIMKIEGTHYMTNENDYRWCPDHAMELTFFCFSHEQHCCVKCAAIKHRVCDCVKELADVLQDPDFSVKTREVQDELNRIHSDLSALLHNREQNAARLGQQHLDIKEKVTFLRNTVVQQVERMMSDTLSEVNNEREKESGTVWKDTNWLRDNKQLVSSLLSKIQVVSQGLELDRFIAYREIQRNMATLKTELPKKIAGMYESNLNFVPSETYDVIMKQFSTFGPVTVKKISCKVEQISSNCAKQYMYDLKAISSFKVSVPDEKTSPKIRSVLFVEGEKLFMVDVNSKSLNLYDIEGTLLHRVFTRGTPAFLSRLQGNRYAVTEPDICEISEYELSNEIKFISSVKAPPGIFGIAVLNDVFVLTCMDCIRVIDQSGKCLQYLNNDSSGKQLFSSIKYILSDPSDSVVYASDDVTNEVFAFKQHPASKLLKQDPLKIYSDPRLKTPTGLNIDKFGNLLVCGFASDNIHLFDKEGVHLKILYSNIKCPLNLEWDSVYNRLVVSMSSSTFHIQFFKTI